MNIYYFHQVNLLIITKRTDHLNQYQSRNGNNEHFFASNKGFGGISNITNFNSFKTKELPTKGILQITPLIVNELYLLNTSFSKDNSITQFVN